MAYQHDAFPVSNTNRSIRSAASCGRLSNIVIDESINFANDNGMTALHCAAKNGYSKCIQVLLLSSDATKKSGDATKKSGDATKKSSDNSVNTLAEKGANIYLKDKWGKTPLHWAAEQSHSRSDCVRVLLDAISDESDIKSYILMRDNKCMTALDYAVDMHNIPVIDLFAKYYINNLNIKTKQRAIAIDNVEVLKKLLSIDPDVSKRDDDGNTLLHMAARRNSYKCAAFLINCKNTGLEVSEHPLINAKNINGNTPLHIAAQHEAKGCIRVLISSGASTEEMNKHKMMPIGYTYNSRKIRELILKCTKKYNDFPHSKHCFY